MRAQSALMARVSGWNRPMLVVAAAMVPIALVAVVGLVVDDRVLAGSPIWLKPFKFAVSIAVYGVTWAWLISLLNVGKRLAARISVGMAAVFFVEQVLIVMQVVRGRGSHFNVMTPFDSAVFSAMGVAIALLWTGSLVLTVLVLRTPFADLATRWALRIGAVVSLAGVGMGALMTTPTSAQLASMDNGTFKGIVGAHTVGFEDSGPTMAVTGWSTVGGDLRIPHFIGMHALQALPLLVLVLAFLATRVPVLRSVVVRTRLVVVAGAGYALLVALVLWQAERGQPLVQPDALTLGALAALVAFVVVGAAVSVLRPVAVAEEVAVG
ncbi:hypothetical protein [Umezawaea sp. Da 62-37]|uniref:hypothetical protein n=1 Tax=Umezawaea sp. Da 62-37 TaxID=3075927 RepID=UPI0028F7049E|nr:hypothetical protein [Umezawaea sp. Da 62-37]WNV90967.1 hypothetical protein RM788_22610 [Umezawaea sp. Da 62-37]